MNVLIVDDHLLFLEAIIDVMSRRLPSVEFRSCTTLADTEKILADTRWKVDLAIIDYHMPGSSGVTVLESLVQRYSSVKFACISGRITRNEISECIRVGIGGFILKEVSSSEMENVITILLNGGVYLPESYYADQKPRIPLESGANLTRREYEILSLVHDGFSNKAISNKLDIKEVTVKRHLTNLFKKYDVKNRTQLAMKSDHDISIRS